MKRLLLLFCLLIPFYFSCKKDSHPDETRPPFTTDQLQWIQCLQNPKYKVITYTKDSLGSIIKTSIDTLLSHNNTQIDETQDPIGDEYRITYYKGEYEFSVTKPNVPDPDFLHAEININNKFDFSVMFTIDIDDHSINGTEEFDTANINGVLYQNVYKFKNLPMHSFPTITKCYYKKGIGFLYLEQSTGRIATLIQ